MTTLIPFLQDPKRVILVGDPKQLPATLFSKNKEATRYERSLFERMNVNQKMHMLRVQYRMHAKIREFPSRMFYNNML